MAPGRLPARPAGSLSDRAGEGCGSGRARIPPSRIGAAMGPLAASHP
jgi:hypothetical protein